jgi:hypothetical protein
MGVILKWILKEHGWVCDLFNDAVSCFDSPRAQRQIKENELERIRKDAIVALFKVDYWHFFEKTEGKPWETSFKIADFKAKICTQNLPNAKQEC